MTYDKFLVEALKGLAECSEHQKPSWIYTHGNIAKFLTSIVGVSLSGPHTSMTLLHPCMCMLGCLLAFLLAWTNCLLWGVGQYNHRPDTYKGQAIAVVQNDCIAIMQIGS